MMCIPIRTMSYDEWFKLKRLNPSDVTIDSHPLVKQHVFRLSAVTKSMTQNRLKNFSGMRNSSKYCWGCFSMKSPTEQHESWYCLYKAVLSLSTTVDGTLSWGSLRIVAWREWHVMQLQRLLVEDDVSSLTCSSSSDEFLYLKNCFANSGTSVMG